MASLSILSGWQNPTSPFGFLKSDAQFASSEVTISEIIMSKPEKDSVLAKVYDIEIMEQIKCSFNINYIIHA